MRSILVIDDESAVARFLETVLTRSGYQVQTAADGQEGIDKFDAGAFDLVITDIRLPRVDGFGVLRHIRASEKAPTPVIGISGTPWLLKEGEFQKVLAKPVPIELLLAAVESVEYPDDPRAENPPCQECLPLFAAEERRRRNDRRR